MKSIYGLLCAAIGILMGCQKPLPTASAEIEVSLLYHEGRIFQGVEVADDSDTLYFSISGKEIYKMKQRDTSPELVTVIEEIFGTWSQREGSLFITDLVLLDNETLLAAAKGKIYQISLKDGSYSPVVENVFSGPWGAYAIEKDNSGNLFVGDHFGGVQYFDIQNGWEQKNLVKPSDTLGVNASFTGVALDEKNKTLYCLDAVNSKLIICSLKWKGGSPEVSSLEMVDLGLNYPEYLTVWQGDVFIQAARENKMVRIRKGEIIQTLTAVGVDDITPGSFVTFQIIPQDETRALFVSTAFNNYEGVYTGEILF